MVNWGRQGGGDLQAPRFIELLAISYRSGFRFVCNGKKDTGNSIEYLNKLMTTDDIDLI